MSKIKLGLIGASKIADKIMPSILKVDDINVVALASKEVVRRKNFIDKWKVPIEFDSYEKCMESNLVNAVYISNLNSMHYDTIIGCLKGGKHILCEKPLVLTVKEAVEAYRIAKERKLILLEGLMYRNHAQIKRLFSTARSEIGKVKHINVEFSFTLYDLTDFSQWARASSLGGGGALNDLGCYGIDFLNQIVKSEVPIYCAASCERFNGIDVDTTVLINYRSGISAKLHFSVVTPSLNIWEVIGTEGSVSAPRFDPQGTNQVPIYHCNTESEVKIEICEANDSFEEQFRRFASSIIFGSQAPVRPEESILNAQIMEEIRLKMI